MTWFRGCALAGIAVVALSASQASAQNLFDNPGFESDITSNGAPFDDNWEGFSGNPAATASVSTASPRTGLQHLNLSILNTDNTFTGVFQDVPGLTPGQSVTFSGWHKRTTTPLDLDAEIRIEWRNATTEVGRTPNTIPTIGLDYEPFSLTATVPTGASIARAVYAIQTFSGGPTNNGTVFLDDLSFVIPEPATGVLACLGLLAVAAKARRR